MQSLLQKLSAIGAQPHENGVSYRVWASNRGRIDVQIEDEDGNLIREVPLRSDAAGYFSGIDEAGKPGDLYRYKINARGAFPDPATRYQPRGVHGPSMVIDSSAYRWNDGGWSAPVFRDFVIYELHIGTFTEEGTFSAAAEKLDYLRDLGVTAVEVMPIADFAGDRNWGYDGVCLFAPARVYGHPDDFRAFVDKAHRLGLAVVLDVVYNHLGPSGCYLQLFSDDYFDTAIHTPWGAAINFSAPQVREFFLSNVTHWIQHFHVDAFRLDATHAIADRSDFHILAEITQLIHSLGCYVIAEDERNDNRVVESRIHGGLGMDAVWADDFHHALDTILIDSSAYKKDFAGELRQLCLALQHGWLFTGNLFAYDGMPRGTECSHLSPTCFIYCISNHDQSGNRALGERPHQLIPAANYRAASALLCLSPYMPLLFMGQEWAASTPFLYFTDHEPSLGSLIQKGRIAELLQRPIPLPVSKIPEVPDPQEAATFLSSKLRWQELEEAEHRKMWLLHKELLKLRRENGALRPFDRAAFEVMELNFGALGIKFRDAQGDWLVICDLTGEHEGNLRDEPALGQSGWDLVLDTNEERFGGTGVNSCDFESGTLRMIEAGLLLLRSTSAPE